MGATCCSSRTEYDGATKAAAALGGAAKSSKGTRDAVKFNPLEEIENTIT